MESCYWSATTGATPDADRVLVLEFYYGRSGTNYKSCGDWVRAVRGGLHFVEPAGVCGGRTPCYKTIQAALNAAANGDTIQAAKTLAPTEPVWGKTGTVSISGGWATDFSARTGTTSMYAPRATGGGGVKVLPNVKIIPKP